MAALVIHEVQNLRGPRAVYDTAREAAEAIMAYDPCAALGTQYELRLSQSRNAPLAYNVLVKDREGDGLGWLSPVAL
jgi:hypothetical protein